MVSLQTYYVDIFYPGLDSTVYIMHTVGKKVDIGTAAKDGSRKATWNVTDSMGVHLWVSGGTKREYFTRMNPASYGYEYSSLTPDGVSTGGKGTPTFYASQKTPTTYANIYEPFIKGKECIKKVTWKYKGGQPVEINVNLYDGTVDKITIKGSIQLKRIRDGKTIFVYK